MFTVGPGFYNLLGSDIAILWDQTYISPIYWLVSGGGLIATQVGGVDYITIISTTGFNTGKRYFEIQVGAVAGSFPIIGIYDKFAGSGDGLLFPNTDHGWGLFASNGNKFHNGSSTSYGSSISNGDVVMVAVDIDAGKIWWGKNGTWFASGDPVAGTNAAYTNVANTVYAAMCGFTSSSGIGGEFTAVYDPPSGYTRW